MDPDHLLAVNSGEQERVHQPRGDLLCSPPLPATDPEVDPEVTTLSAEEVPAEEPMRMLILRLQY